MHTETLCKNWEHSVEEDTADEMVFRPSSYAFPLRRGGRDAIDLRTDHTFTQRGDLLGERSNLAADDRYNYAEGSWSLDESQTLSLTPRASAGSASFRIISLTDDKLVIKMV